MPVSGNLWAVGYDDMERANQVREEIISLGWDQHYLRLEDIAVVVRQGSQLTRAGSQSEFPILQTVWHSW
jgi:uncharacterized membrane protein